MTKKATNVFQVNGEELYLLGVDMKTDTTSDRPASASSIADMYGSFSQYVDYEFVRVIVDSNNNILWGIRTDGTIHYGAGIPPQIKDEIDRIIGNIDFSEIISDIENVSDNLSSLTEDVNIMSSTVATISNNLDDVSSDLSTLDSSIKDTYGDFVYNPEYLKIIIDDSSNIIWGIKTDGTIHYGAGVPEQIQSKLDEIGNVIDSSVLPHINDNEIYFDDPEDRISMLVDDSSRIISSRLSDGTLKENVGIETETITASYIKTDEIEIEDIKLSSNGVSSLYTALLENGLVNPYDHSAKTYLDIPMPRFVIMNIPGETALPTTKTEDRPMWIEVWDNNGNFFKKRIIGNAQGNSTLGYPKKSLSMDICNDEWIGDDTFELKIGDWVPQDSFHIKANYIDTFRGIMPCEYKLFDEISRTRGFLNDRTWKRALLPETAYTGLTSYSMTDESLEICFDNGARCVPDGFPVLMYLSGEFYGIYSWQLKKHRDNYMMKKKKAEHIHLDGMISTETVWRSEIDWDILSGTKAVPAGNTDGLEFRTPKDLICIDGTEYDGDNNRQELIDENCELYDAENEDMVRTAQVKKYFLNFTQYLIELNSYVSEHSSDETFETDIRTEVEKRFDVVSLIDFQIFSDFIDNVDGYRKNWQWTTWDGIRWAVNPYDLDWTAGYMGRDETYEPRSGFVGSQSLTVNPCYYAIRFYKDEMDARYKELKDLGILNALHMTTIMHDWMLSVGIKYYEMEFEKWPNSRTTDNIYRLYNFYTKKIEYMDALYNYN